MNLPEPNVVLRARGALENVDLAFPFIARLGGRRYALLALLGSAPPALAILLLRARFELSWLQCWLAAVPLAIWLQGLFTVAAGESMFAGELRAGAVLRAFARRLVPYTAALVVSRLAIAAAMISVVFLPFAWAHFLFVPEAVLLEGAAVSPALARAGRLARANRGRMLELVFALAGLLALGVVLAETMGNAVVDDVLQLGVDAGGLFSEGGSYYAIAGLFAAVPLATTVRFLSYIDGRARGDAWDVQIKFQRIARAEATGS